MVNAEQVKNIAGEYLDPKTIVSVIAAGAFMTVAVVGLRKIGFKKAASVVAKAK